jgi:hypothetical protein
MLGPAAAGCASRPALVQTEVLSLVVADPLNGPATKFVDEKAGPYPFVVVEMQSYGPKGGRYWIGWLDRWHAWGQKALVFLAMDGYPAPHDFEEKAFARGFRVTEGDVRLGTRNVRYYLVEPMPGGGRAAQRWMTWVATDAK